MDNTAEQLKLLSIFHWVIAAFASLFGLFPLLYVGMGTAMLHGLFPDGRAGASRSGGPPVEFLGWFMVAMGLVFCLGFLTYAVALGFAAKNYARHRHWTYCLVVAIISCGWFPFGTMLGVFSILTLARPETKALFGEGQPVPLASVVSAEERTPFR